MKAMPRLRILVDNCAEVGLKAEHGLAVWIEAGGKKILFDTGAGGALRANTEATRFDPARADFLVLSHGHFDHTGAVDYVLERNPEIELFAHLGIFRERFSLYEGQPPKEISMPSEQRLVAANVLDSKLHWVKDPSELAPGVWLSGAIPRNHPLEDVGGPYFQDRSGRRADSIPDDQVLWVETPRGLLVVCGCCHAGLINTLEHIRGTVGDTPIWAIMGGFHLKHASTERLDATVAALENAAPELLVPCHCTGEAAVEYLKQHLSISVQSGFAGFELSTD